MKVARSVAEVLAEHTTLTLECIDRMYLNVDVPLLQRAAGGVLLPQDAGRGRTVLGPDGPHDPALR